LLAAPFPDGWRRGYILPPLQGLGNGSPKSVG